MRNEKKANSGESVDAKTNRKRRGRERKLKRAKRQEQEATDEIPTK